MSPSKQYLILEDHWKTLKEADKNAATASIDTYKPINTSTITAIYLKLTCRTLFHFQPQSVANEVRPDSHSSLLSKVHRPVPHPLHGRGATVQSSFISSSPPVTLAACQLRRRPAWVTSHIGAACVTPQTQRPGGVGMA